MYIILCVYIYIYYMIYIYIHIIWYMIYIYISYVSHFFTVCRVPPTTAAKHPAPARKEMKNSWCHGRNTRETWWFNKHWEVAINRILTTKKNQDSINRNLRSPRHASQMLGSSVLGNAHWAFSQCHNGRSQTAFLERTRDFLKDNQKVYPKRKPNLAGGQSRNIDQPSLDSSADTLPAQRPCWWGPRFADAQRKEGWVFGWKRWQPVWMLSSVCTHARTYVLTYVFSPQCMHGYIYIIQSFTCIYIYTVTDIYAHVCVHLYILFI